MVAHETDETQHKGAALGCRSQTEEQGGRMTQAGNVSGKWCGVKEYT